MHFFVASYNSRPEDDEEEMFLWMKSNFDKHYNGNRAPFGVFIHAAWFLVRDSHFPAYKRLVAYMNSLPDVYMVSVSQAVDYVRNPVPWFDEEAPEVEVEETTDEPTEENNNNNGQEEVDEVEEVEEVDEVVDVRRFTRRGVQILETCQKMPEYNCQPTLCQLTKEVSNEERWMTACVPCPSVYPWLDNPLGEDRRK